MGPVVCPRRRRLGTSPSPTLTTVVVPVFSIGVLPRGYGAWILAPYRGTGQAFDRENDDFWGPAGPYPGRFANRPYGDGGGRRAGRLVPAHQGMKSLSCGLARWVLPRHAPTQRGTSPRPTLTTVVVPVFSIGVLPRGCGAWILAPYQGTGQAFDRENDDFWGPAGIPTRASYDEPGERIG